MKRIWKFDLDDVAFQHVEMPAGSRPLTVQSQVDTVNGRLTLVLWAICDASAMEMVKYPVWQYETGETIGKDTEACSAATRS